MQDKCNAILALTAWHAQVSDELVGLAKITPKDSVAHIKLSAIADAMIGVNKATQRIQDIMEVELRELEAKENARN